MEEFVCGLPKCELHLHIEGTFEPELMFAIAQRNRLELPYASVEEVRAAYSFDNLQQFLDIYYKACDVLREEQDFYDLTWAYLERAHANGVRHAEIFFDPQTHTDRGVPFGTVAGGISRALADGEARLGVTSRLIMCFLRHLDEEAALATLEAARPHLGAIAAVGLDSGEDGNPPEKFSRVYALARELGLRAVAHAGEEGPPANIVRALDDLGVERIDHGVRCLEDDATVARLARDGVPLTVCPNSNECLKVVERYFGGVSPVRRLVDAGVVVTLNSDDPAYFGGYLCDNYLRAARDANLSRDELVELARNSFRASFLDDDAKARLVAEVDAYALKAGAGK